MRLDHYDEVHHRLKLHLSGPATDVAGNPPAIRILVCESPSPVMF